MKIKIERDKAKDLIVERQYFFLTESDKLKILERIFPVLEDTEYVRDLIADGELPNLDEKIIQFIESKEYLTIPIHKSLKPIFMYELKEGLIGVTNEYLEIHLNSHEHTYIVTGLIEEKGVCPCCKFYAIAPGEDGLHNICPVCFWQNGGPSPNHMTLQKAQENFKLFGAIDKGALQFIDPEGKIKYQKKEDL